jgi:hemoglobin
MRMAADSKLVFNILLLTRSGATQQDKISQYHFKDTAMQAEVKTAFTPRPSAPGLKCGITEEMTARLVHAFYARVRADTVLGPVFEGAIQDWDSHLAKLCDFWSSVTLMTGRYKGRPVPAHVGLPGIGPAMFARWLGLFRETARKECPPSAAALYIASAERIASSLQMSIDFHRGVLSANLTERK